MVDPILRPVDGNTLSSSFKAISSIALFLLVSSVTLSQAHAHGGGWGSCSKNSKNWGGGWYSSYPRYSSSYRRGGAQGCGVRPCRSYYHNRRPMDIVGELLVDINSLLRQPSTQSYQTTTKDSQANTTKRHRSESGEIKNEEDSSFNTAGRPPSRFEIFENGPNGMVELTMEIPGVAAEDVSVEVENGTLLRIRASRTRQPLEEVDTARASRGSRQVTKQRAVFEEVFVLDDDMDVDQLLVTLWRGLLSVQIPKKAKVVRRIPIRLERDGTRDDDDDDTPKILNVRQKKSKESNKMKKNVKSFKRSGRINEDDIEEEDGEDGLEFLDDDDDDDDDAL